jgi:hypothetical protein
MDRSAFVEVPEADASRVMEALSRTKLRGKKVYVDIARPRREMDWPERGPGQEPSFAPRSRFQGAGAFPSRRDFERGGRNDFDARPPRRDDDHFHRDSHKRNGKPAPGGKHSRKK